MVIILDREKIEFIFMGKKICWCMEHVNKM